MAAKITKVPNGENINNKHREQIIDLLCDSSYPAGGYTVPPAACGMKSIFGAEVIGQNTAAAGYVAQFNVTTGKLMVMRSAPAGTIGGNVTVKGGTLGEAIGINPDSNAGVLSKAAATDRAIPIATLLGAAPTFTGTAAALAAVTGDIATLSFRLKVVGY